MIPSQDDFYISQDEPTRGSLLALRKMIKEQDPLISETIKYRMPCFCYMNKPFCYLWTDKKTDEPYILMVEGNLLHHPVLETGKRSRMKAFKLNPHLDLPVELVIEVLQLGLELYKKGIVKVK